MYKLEQLKKKLSEKKDELSKRYGFRQIGIFGSYVRGRQKKLSDIDILVELDENSNISLLDFVHVENELSDFLGVKVDLVIKSALKPHIGAHILKEVIYL